MKYRVTTTTADRVNGCTYSSARAALTAYNNTREIYARAGYIIADAGKGRNSRAELWIKEGRGGRNIEIWPVAPRANRTHAARTADRIKTHAKRAARRFRAAALLLLVRVLFMAVGLCSWLAVMFGAALIIPEVTPDGFAACLLLRVPAMFAVTGLWGFAWCWSVQHILPARLLYYIRCGNC